MMCITAQTACTSTSIASGAKMRNKWVAGIGWTLLVLFALGNVEKNPGATAICFLTGVVIYWGRRIEVSIKALKE
jgi:hypothetical protein